MRIHVLIYFIFAFCCLSQAKRSDGTKEREYWVDQLCHIAKPVLNNLANNTLAAQMPLEFRYTNDSARLAEVKLLEVTGRTLYGISPWLELGPDNTREGRKREEMLQLAIKGLQNGLDSLSPDYLNFRKHHQPLVDAALLVQAFLRSPTQLWGGLDQQTRNRVIVELRECLKITPYYNNWLLFPAVIELFLYDKTGSCDLSKVELALKEHKSWYKGDAWYGDGKDFHYDYYNSFMIHPLLYDILSLLKKHNLGHLDFYEEHSRRFSRHAAQLERMISPEGAIPVIGRSMVYRCGTLNALSQASLAGLLPAYLEPAQVRCALTAVFKRSLASKNNFDKKGWLRFGFCGYQPEIAEGYISTASLYFMTVAFAPLGLPETDPFWSNPAADWTSRKAYQGERFEKDASMTHN